MKKSNTMYKLIIRLQNGDYEEITNVSCDIKKVLEDADFKDGLLIFNDIAINKIHITSISWEKV